MTSIKISEKRHNEIWQEMQREQPYFDRIINISIDSINETTTRYKVKYREIIMGHKDVDVEYITLPNEITEESKKAGS
jgi:hypothetical protein